MYLGIIFSTELWNKLISVKGSEYDGSENAMIKLHATRLIIGTTSILWAISTMAADFEHRFVHVFSAEADSYIVATTNIQKRYEGGNIRYYHPIENNKEASITYRFDFGAASTSAFLSANLYAVNFGSDYGRGSLWGSTNGSDWTLILDMPTPSYEGRAAYKTNLPASLIGGNSIWLQARLYTVSWNITAQWLRWLDIPYIFEFTADLEKQNQFITFLPIGDKLASDLVGLSATASSGLPVSFSVVGGPATISGGTNLTFTGAGTVSIVASQAGDESWSPAPNVTNTFEVSSGQSTSTLGGNAYNDLQADGVLDLADPALANRTVFAYDDLSTGNWVDLIGLVNPVSDTTNAAWNVSANGVQFGAGKPRAYVTVPLQTNGNYDLEYHISITQSKETVRLYLPVGDRHVLLDIRGDLGNTGSPTATITLLSASPSPAARVARKVLIGTEYQFMCKVRVVGDDAVVEIFNGGALMFSWVGKLAGIAATSTISARHVGLETAYYTYAQIYLFRLRPAFSETIVKDLTDSAGAFALDGVPTRNVTLRHFLQEGWKETRGVNPFGLSPGGSVTKVFLAFKESVVEGYVFNDTNRNCALESSEPKVYDTVVFKDDNFNESLDEGEISYRTAANGKWIADRLIAGVYQFCVIPPTNWSDICNSPTVVSNASPGATLSGNNFGIVTGKADQIIAFPPIGDKLTTDTVGLAATASSGLPVSFAVASGPVTLSGGTNLSFTGAGTVSIVASQAGDENWNAALSVTNTFNVTVAALVIAPTSTNVPASASAGRQIAITANMDWTAATDAPWLSITSSGSGSGNGTVMYIVAENVTTLARTGMITIAGGGLSRTCTVIQAGATPSLGIAPASTNIPATASSGLQISVAANMGWSSAANVPWLAITAGSTGTGNGTVMYSVARNIAPTARTGTITIAGGGITRACHVVQLEGEDRPMVQAESHFGMISNQYGFHFNWTSGRVVVVEACTNLINANWIPLQTNALGNVPAFFGDSNWANYKGRYYRIRAISGGIILTGTMAQADFNGDMAADLVVFTPSGGLWDFLYSTGETGSTAYGWSAVVPVPADYDGDGKADLAVYHPAAGNWYIHPSGGSADRVEQLGSSSTIPLPGDYDGDGKADLAVFNRSTAWWNFHYSSGKPDYDLAYGWSAVVPVPADYNGDGKADIAVYHPATGNWYPATGPVVQLGGGKALPVSADYDGDGKADVAVFTQSNAQWKIMYSAGGSLTLEYGWSAVLPVVADYDGDGKADIAVYHPPTGMWYILQSSTGRRRDVQFGGSEAQPVLLYPMIHSWFGLP